MDVFSNAIRKRLGHGFPVDLVHSLVKHVITGNETEGMAAAKTREQEDMEQLMLSTRWWETVTA